jgi:hypothetical protein
MLTIVCFGFLALTFCGRAAICASDIGRVGNDRAFHLAFISMLRRSGHRPSAKDARFLLDATPTYPALYHWLLSFVPERGVVLADRWSGFIYDLVVGVLVCGLLHYTNADFSVGQLAVVGGLYFIAPALTLKHVGPRAFSLTPRSFSQLFSGLLVVLALSPPVMPPLARGAIAVACMAIMLASSKFSLQVLLFTVPLFGALARSALPLICLVLAASVTVLASRGYVLRQIANQVRHLQWYRRRNLAFLRMRGSWRALLQAVRDGDLTGITQEVLVRNPLLAGLFRHLLLFIGLALTLRVPHLATSVSTAVFICLAVVPAWLITSQGAFRILGEAERYLEFGFPAEWYLFWMVLPVSLRSAALLLLAVAHVALMTVNVVALLRQARLLDVSAWQDVARAIRAQPQQRVLPCDDLDVYSLFLDTDAVIYAMQHPLSPGLLGWQFVDRFYGPYPFVNSEVIAELCESSSVDLLLLPKEGISATQLQAQISHVTLRVIHHNSKYELASVTAVESTSVGALL